MPAQAVYDDPGIHFRGPAHALRWAEEFASRPNYPSWHRVINSPRTGVPTRGVTYHELGDLAQTITLAARMIDPSEARDAFLLATLYGPGVRQAFAGVATMLRYRVTASKLAEGLSRRQSLALAMVSARDFRLFQQTGKRLPRKAYAQRLGIARTGLYREPWPGLIQHCGETLAQWYVEAYKSLHDKLRDIGVT